MARLAGRKERQSESLARRTSHSSSASLGPSGGGLCRGVSTLGVSGRMERGLPWRCRGCKVKLAIRHPGWMVVSRSVSDVNPREKVGIMSRFGVVSALLPRFAFPTSAMAAHQFAS